MPFGSVQSRFVPFSFIPCCYVSLVFWSLRAPIFGPFFCRACVSQREIFSSERSRRASACRAAEPPAGHGRRGRSASSRLRHTSKLCRCSLRQLRRVSGYSCTAKVIATVEVLQLKLQLQDHGCCFAVIVAVVLSR